LFRVILFILLSVNVFALSNSDVIANYWMDECEWGVVYDKSGNGHDASPQVNANTSSGGVIFRDGNLTGSNYLSLNDKLTLSDNYSIKLWVKFPLEDRADNDYFFVADREGSDVDFIYFKKETRTYGIREVTNWYWCLRTDDGIEHCNSFTPPDDGWHMVTFTANKADYQTYFYIDDNTPDRMNFYVGGELSLIGGSDKGDSDNDSIGAFVDEYIIFNKQLSDDEVASVFQNESNKLNFDGTQRYNLNVTPLEMEVGSVDLISTYSNPIWTHVTFKRKFKTTPVVFSVAGARGAQPASVRFKNITTTGFDIVLVEPKDNDGMHLSQTVSYVAITPGLHVLDGHYIDVKTYSTKAYQVHASDPNKSWDRVSLDIPICNSAILANIQTLNNLLEPVPGNPLAPWTTAAIQKVDASTLDIALDKSEVFPDEIVNPETIAVLATDGEVSGTFKDSENNEITYEFRFIPKYFKGWTTKLYVDFLNTYDEVPLSVGWKDSRYGPDGGWARLKDIQVDKISYVVDEDNYNDSERNHIPEDFGFLVFSKAFHIGLMNVISLKMDECEWDDDSTTYEVFNSGEFGDEYNATALNSAQVTDGKICNGGDFNATESDRAMLLKNPYPLPEKYTINLWVKFPLVEDGHKNFGPNAGNFLYYYTIADRVGSDNRFIYFKDEKNYGSESWSLVVEDDNGADSYDLNPQDLDGWHMLTFVVSESGTRFYLDKEYKYTFSTHPTTGEMQLLFNGDYDSSDNQPNGQSIGSVVDEFNVFNYDLSDSEIADLYDESRACPICDTTGNLNSMFNAVDLVESDCNAIDNWDDNITTKYVNSDYNLTILSKDPDSNRPLRAYITKIELRFYTDGDNSQCSGDLVGTQLVCTDCGYTDEYGCMDIGENLKVTKAVKCIQVYIEGRAASNTSDDVNSSLSSDDYAAIPYEFKISSVTDQKAGSEFTLSFKAVDLNGNSVEDYNESVHINGESVDMEYKDENCKTGVLTKVDGGEFADGEGSIKLKYSEVGDVLFSIKEVIGSEFAKVDSDDTPDSLRIIGEAGLHSTFVVHHFKASSSLSDYDTQGSFTYLDGSYTIMGLNDLTITAQNEQNETTENYNSACYAKDVDVNISLDGVDSSLDKVLYYIVDAKGNKGSNEETDIDNFSFTIDSDNFTTDNNGSASIKVYFNFNRSDSKALNPFDVTIKDLAVKNEDTSDYNDESSGALHMLYGRLNTNDIVVSSDEFNQTSEFIFYDEKSTHEHEVTYFWWLNKLHQSIDGNITSSEFKITNGYSTNDESVDISVENVEIKDGRLIISMKKNQNFDFAVVHLLSPNLSWLWYSKYNEKYDISDGSTCKNHFCFTITYESARDTSSLVKSGKDVNGTEVNVTTIPKPSLKIFR